MSLLLQKKIYLKSHRHRQCSVQLWKKLHCSGNGAHVWIFFAEPVPASNARQLGAALISQTCDRTRQLAIKSYDRFFPNQDTLPKGGFGNLIALPLQQKPRSKGFSVFVDENFVIYYATEILRFYPI